MISGTAVIAVGVLGLSAAGGTLWMLGSRDFAGAHGPLLQVRGVLEGVIERRVGVHDDGEVPRPLNQPWNHRPPASAERKVDPYIPFRSATWLAGGRCGAGW